VIASGVPVRSPATGRCGQELGVPTESAIAVRDGPVLLVTAAALYLPGEGTASAGRRTADHKSIARACAAGI
jgi:hypothetical protein